MPSPLLNSYAAAPLGLMAPRLRRAGAERIVATTHGHELWWAKVPIARGLLRRISDGADTVTCLGEYTRTRIARAVGPQGADRLARLGGTARAADGGQLVAQKVTGITPEELRQLTSDTLAHLPAGPAVVVLALEHSGRALLAAAVSPHLLGRGVQAAQVIARAAKTVGGGGGGTGALASAGGRRPGHLDQALTAAADDAMALLHDR